MFCFVNLISRKQNMTPDPHRLMVLAISLTIYIYPAIALVGLTSHPSEISLIAELAVFIKAYIVTVASKHTTLLSSRRHFSFIGMVFLGEVSYFILFIVFVFLVFHVKLIS